jgi:hypothetical protein
MSQAQKQLHLFKLKFLLKEFLFCFNAHLTPNNFK